MDSYPTKKINRKVAKLNYFAQVIHHMSNSNGNSNKRQMDEELNNINITSMSHNNLDQSTASYNPNHSRASHSSPIYSNDQLVSSLKIPTN